MSIPPSRICFSDDDRREISSRIEECLASGQVAQGKNVKQFEESFARYCQSRHAVAMSNGGSSIEALMWALGVDGKEVLVPTNTAFATAAGVMRCGGIPILVDADKETFSIDLDTIKDRAGQNTAGVIAVHIGGIITPQILEIKEWCDSHKIWLVEDCAHAHGSEYAGRRAGTFGIAGAYSFFATKVMTTGEGGMVVTNEKSLAARISRLRDYGKPDPWVTYSTELGTNWRMTEWSAAIGLIQLKRLDEIIARRQEIAQFYTQELQDVAGLKPVLPQGRCSWYKYIVLLEKGIDRNRLKTAANEHGVQFSGGVYDSPLHQQPVFHGKVVGSFPRADEICSHHVCLPLYYDMTVQEAVHVIETLRTLL